MDSDTISWSVLLCCVADLVSRDCLVCGLRGTITIYIWTVVVLPIPPNKNLTILHYSQNLKLKTQYKQTNWRIILFSIPQAFGQLPKWVLLSFGQLSSDPHPVFNVDQLACSASWFILHIIAFEVVQTTYNQVGPNSFAPKHILLGDVLLVG